MFVEVPLSDTVTAGTAYQAGSEGIIVGSPPVWKDDSTATYASFAGQYFGDGNPQFVGDAQAAVSSAPARSIAAATRIVARFQVAGEQGSGLLLPSVRLERSTTYRFSAAPAGAAPASPSWIEAELTSQEPLAFADFIADPTRYALALVAPLYPSPVPNEIHRWRAYEARLYVDIPTFDAPPCRLHPRSDGLGVGSGRNYPPAKSQQRSNRGVGYY